MLVEIPGIPISKSRHRTFLRHGKIMTYDCQNEEKLFVKNFLKNFVNLKLTSFNHEDVIEISKILKARAFSISFNFYLPFPKTDSVVRENRTLWGFDHMTDKPDCDNLEKFYLDCANGILYQDDRQIIHMESKKIYCSKPKTVINIMPVHSIQLDPKAEKIFENISPSQLVELMEVINELHSCSLDFDEEPIIPDSDHNREIYQKRLARTACLLSELSEVYLPYFKKISKSCPNYYLECKTDLHRFGKPIC